MTTKTRERSAAHGGTWAELREELFTPEERAECDIRVKLIGKLIEARGEQNMSQRALAEKTGIKQPVIARLERGTRSPQLSTIIRLLHPLGYTLDVVPLSSDGTQEHATR